MSQVRSKLVKLVNDYLELHDEDSTRIYIPILIESEMIAEGDVFHKGFVDRNEGVREVLGDPPMFGTYTLVWDAEELKVERVESDISIINNKLLGR